MPETVNRQRDGHAVSTFFAEVLVRTGFAAFKGLMSTCRGATGGTWVREVF
jgi:hypothetical protein